MNFLQTLLMWFPPCALFVAVAYVTEFAWRSEDFKIRRRFFRLDSKREAIRQEDGTPLMYVD